MSAQTKAAISKAIADIKDIVLVLTQPKEWEKQDQTRCATRDALNSHRSESRLDIPPGHGGD
jgi:hypothetical protein